MNIDYLGYGTTLLGIFIAQVVAPALIIWLFYRAYKKQKESSLKKDKEKNNP